MKDQDISKNKVDWRLAAGILASIAVVVLIVFNVINYMQKHSPETYDQVLSEYYNANAKNITNALNTITTPDFTDETSMLRLTPGKYIVFRYQYEELPVSTNTQENLSNNSKPAFSKSLFSVSTTEDKNRLSYLNEAYFVFENGKAKLKQIKKLYVGKNITR